MAVIRDNDSTGLDQAMRELEGVIQELATTLQSLAANLQNGSAGAMDTGLAAAQGLRMQIAGAPAAVAAGPLPSASDASAQGIAPGLGQATSASAMTGNAGVLTAAGAYWMGNGGGAAVATASAGAAGTLGGGGGIDPDAVSGFSQYWGQFSQRQQARLFGEGARIAGAGINLLNIDDTHTDDITGARYGAYAGIVSGAVGLGAGLLSANPMVVGVVGGAVNAVLQPVAQYLARPQDYTDKSNRLLSDFTGAYGGLGGAAINDALTQSPGNRVNTVTPFGPIGTPINSRLADIGAAANVAGQLPDNLAFGNPKGAPDPALAATFAGVTSGLFAGGLDPFAAGASRSALTAFPFANNADAARLENLPGAGRGLLDTFLAAGGAAVRNSRQTIPGGDETLAETYTRRLGTLFGNESPNVVKDIAPIFGSLPETGGNVADILTRFGAQNTATFLRLQNDDLTSSVDPLTLSRTSANLRAGDRQAAIAATQARGVGGALTSIYRGELADLAGLPGGLESQRAADVRRDLRDATVENYRTQDITRFDIPEARLSGARQRALDNPFNPSNLFAIDAGIIGESRQRVARIGSEIDALRQSGNLTEDQELRLTQQHERYLTTENAAVREITDGRENLIPGLTAGRPRTIGAFTSDQAEALSFANGQVPYRFAGAVNGSDLARQNRFASDLGLSENDLRPLSRTSGINNGIGGGDTGAAILGVLQAILSAVTGNSAQGGRTTEGVGAAAAWIGSRDVARGNNTTRDFGAN